jgi:hypothetical protein
MGDRTFDEAIAPEGLGIAERMQPVFIGPSPVAERFAWEDPNETPDCVEFGMVFERGTLKAKTISMHPVIGIDPRDKGTSATGRAFDEAVDESIMRLREDTKPGVAIGLATGHFEAAIRRPVIDQDTLEVGFTLAFDAAQAGLEGGFRVPHRKEDRDSRAGSDHGLA